MLSLISITSSGYLPPRRSALGLGAPRSRRRRV